MLPGVLKAKLFVAEHGWSVAVALAVVGVCCLGAAGVVVATPPTEEYTVETDEQTFTSEVDTSAVVTNGSSVWREGTRIENAPVYVLSAAPNLTLSHTVSVPEGASVALNRTITVEYRAQRDEQTFWRTRETVASDVRNVTDGAFAATTRLDVRRIQERQAELERILGDSGTIQPYIAVNATYETASYSGTLNASAPLTIDANTYAIGGGLDANQTRTTPVTRTRKGSADPLIYVPLFALGAGCLVAAALVGQLLRRGIDAGAVRQRLHEQRYSEWLSAGTVPESAPGSVVWMDSLEDLVDVAIDTDKRAIVDRERGRYAVLDGDVHYYHEPEQPERADAGREERDATETGVAEDHERGEESERDAATDEEAAEADETTDEETTTDEEEAEEETVVDQTRA